MKKKILGLLSFLISITLIVLLLSVVNIHQMISTLISISLSFYGAAFIFYIVAYFSRTLRLTVLFGPNNSSNFFLIICGHMFLNHFLPFRTGEFSLPFFLKKIIGVPYSKSMPLLVLLRLLDLIAVIFTFLLLLTLFSVAVSSSIVSLSIILLILGVFAVFNLKTIFYWLMKLLSKLSPQKFTHKIEKVKTSINEALTLNNRQMFKLSILSLIDRICGYAMSIFLVIGMSYQIPILQLIIANAVASITNVIPINSIGSFGTLELGWAGALLLFGVPKEIAVSSGFNFHILALTFTITLGLISLLIMSIRFNINPFKQSIQSREVK